MWKKYLEYALAAVLVIGGLIAVTAAIGTYDNTDTLCRMRLSLVKTLPDSVRFLQSDTGSVCLNHIPRRRY